MLLVVVCLKAAKNQTHIVYSERAVKVYFCKSLLQIKFKVDHFHVENWYIFDIFLCL